MFNIKWGVVAGAVAFILSLALGILHGANVLHVILRALIFAGVFFGLGMGIWVLINNFIPELLFTGDQEDQAPEVPGSRVNITLDGNRGFAAPEMYRNPDNPDEVGNIDDLMSGAINPGAAVAAGMDQNEGNGYNFDKGGGADSQNQDDAGFPNVSAFDDGPDPAESAPAAAFVPSFGGSDGLGGLPDLDAMAGAFLTNAGEESAPLAAAMPTPVAAASPAAEPERGYAGNKPQPLKGDFNPKELAEGLRTVLSKDK
ncbi:hypothetical protein AGMMS50293_14460 [Spirochaetia bacterium]|nr:hypothetical protein AGMMS50293_14460 [Spirochaetia bacterium]